jgi:FKBP-type peptidyl-prolyl cis-trans isomerase SlyD
MIANNHPLAGVQLNFFVEVTEVRKASKTELEHGHVHDSNEHHA